MGAPLVKLSIVGNVCKEKTKRDKLNYFLFFPLKISSAEELARIGERTGDFSAAFSHMQL